jgi:hypothetical protein
MACRFNKCTSIGMSTELMQVGKVGIQGSIPSGFLSSAQVVFMLLLHVKIKGGHKVPHINPQNFGLKIC